MSASAKTTVTATASGYPPVRRPLASHINSPNKSRAVSNPNPNKRPRSPDPSLSTAPVVAHPALKRLKKEHITATIGPGKEMTSRASLTTTTSNKPPPSAVSSKRSKAEKAAAEEEFRVKYGRAFPSWKFYFEAVPQAAVASATRKILELNGVCPDRRDAMTAVSLCAFCRPLKGSYRRTAHISSLRRVSTRRTRPQLPGFSKYPSRGDTTQSHRFAEVSSWLMRTLEACVAC
jgi:hypothetical protein